MFFDLPEMKRAALLREPPAILATALLELPEVFHRLDADDLRERAFGADFPELSGQIDELREVHQFVVSGLMVARDDAMGSAGIGLSEFNLALWNGDPAN